MYVAGGFILWRAWQMREQRAKDWGEAFSLAFKAFPRGPEAVYIDMNKGVLGVDPL